TGNPGLEEIIAIAELDLTQAAAMLMRVDETGHQQAIRQRHDARLRPARRQRLRIADLGDAAIPHNHAAILHQAVGARRRKHIVGLQDRAVGHRSVGAAVDRRPVSISRSDLMKYYCPESVAQMPAWDDRRPRRPTFGWSDGRALLVLFALV